MSFQQRALQELAAARASARPGQKNVVVGLDGFVDTIVTPVAQRTGQGDAFTAIGTITEFGQRVLSAAGKSTNIEFFPRMEKLGGNGPIMANALLAAGSALTYIGALGKDDAIHPVFADMAARSRVISLCAPAATTAVEFLDGKLMLGQMKSLDEITWAKLAEKPGEDELLRILAAADLVALVNWTMIPNMTGVFTELADRVLPKLPARPSGAPARIFFFDLADPEKRSAHDLVDALAAIARFEQHGQVTLGLNFKEAQQVYAALGLGVSEGDDEQNLRQTASAIRQKLALSTVVVHPRASAACATADGDFWVPGPFCEKPLITTGAGDHFNAGFTHGQLLGLSPEACLVTGVCTSGHYVRSAHSPSLADLETFLARWR
ncbi:sugar kinase, ribokinase [Opitutaceae bacterium TAV1]|nr:sugar kinase ribokinase [Opitutaceae bacterium TAV5]EIQ02071.1 sugar kinase, ribokinase [Opitutaceae bacterium TAV1]